MLYFPRVRNLEFFQEVSERLLKIWSCVSTETTWHFLTSFPLYNFFYFLFFCRSFCLEMGRYTLWHLLDLALRGRITFDGSHRYQDERTQSPHPFYSLSLLSPHWFSYSVQVHLSLKVLWPFIHRPAMCYYEMERPRLRNRKCHQCSCRCTIVINIR